MPAPSSHRVGLAIGAAALAALTAGCAGAAQPAATSTTGARSARSAAAPPAAVPAAAARSGCAVRGASRRADATLRLAQHRYLDEQGGSVIHSDLRRIARDRRLLRALAANDLRAAQAEAVAELASHHHVVQLRILRGQRIVVDANPRSFDVAGSARTLTGPHGRRLGTLQITVQDVIGFIKLAHRHDGAAATVVRGAAGHVETDLPLAAHRRLPGRGCVTVAGSPYLVRSFRAANFTGEALTIWLLVRP